MSEQSKGVKVFIAYSHEDESLKKRLEVHLTILKRQGFISTWYDGEMVPGKTWTTQTKNELGSADIVLLLISPDFLASNFRTELPKTMDTSKRSEVDVIPIILKECEWHLAVVGSFKALYIDTDKPVSSLEYWDGPDDAFTSITKGIKGVILREERKNIVQHPGGPLKPAASNYIKRPADDQLNLLLNPASPPAFYLITGGIQCGKTSLLRRFDDAAQKKGYRTNYVDFLEMKNKTNISVEDTFGHIYRVVDESSGKKGEKGNTQRSKEWLFEYFKQVIEKDEKHFLIIDSMDILLSRSKDQDVLNELIAWLSMLRFYQGEAPFNRLTIIAAMTPLSYSAVYTSPLRTQAVKILLPHFGHTEIETLLNIYGMGTDIRLTTAQVMELFGGQPNLSHLAVFDIYMGNNFPGIRAKAFMPMNGYLDYWVRVKEVLELVLKIKNYYKNMVSVFEVLNSKTKTNNDYKVVADLFEELYRLDIITLNHEIFSVFIENAIKKEIEANQ